MEEKNIKEVAPVSEGEFKEMLENTLNLQYFECTKRFKSVNRAFKRGHITNYGYILPVRPFNNRKHTAGRKDNINKKRIWEKVTGKRVMYGTGL